MPATAAAEPSLLQVVSRFDQRREAFSCSYLQQKVAFLGLQANPPRSGERSYNTPMTSFVASEFYTALVHRAFNARSGSRQDFRSIAPFPAKALGVFCDEVLHSVTPGR